MTNSSLDLGPLEPFLTDPAVTAIHVDGTSVRYKKGEQEFSGDVDVEHGALLEIIHRIVNAGGAQLTAAAPIADCVLSDGTRVHAALTPLSISLYKR